MTRSTLKRTLRRVYAAIAIVLAISLIAKLVDHIPVLNTSAIGGVLKDVYEYLRDMSLLLATGGVAYIANIYQKRDSFIDALKEEWRDIIATKSALIAYTHLERPTQEQYVQAFCKISETIDNMRSVYCNVGETSQLIGLYPFEPLHDMRRVLQSLDPRRGVHDAETRSACRDAIVRSFNAVRETFLEELDLEGPSKPILAVGARRLKKPGAAGYANGLLRKQLAALNTSGTPEPQLDALLQRLREEEHSRGAGLANASHQAPA
jgi:hypothetical protein